MQGMYNMRSPAVKRLMKEAQELREPTEQFYAQPLEDNLFEWHFTIRGPEDSEFDGGVYHGRIVLPPEYPMKPPSIILLTPNGRFETLKKICLSISGHHPESWQPSWSIRTALLAIIGFMPTHGNGAIGSLDYTPEERKVLAKKTQTWKCPTCGDMSSILLPVTEASEKTRQEARELATQIDFQGEKEKKGSESSGSIANSSDIRDTEAGAAASNSPGVGAQPSPPLVFPQPGQPGLPPFGQYPFAGFPFPPPFIPPTNFTQGENTNRSNVPRFPLPYFPPMFAPPFPPMGFSGGTGIAPPPWGAPNQGTGVSSKVTSSSITRTSSTSSTSSDNVQKSSRSCPSGDKSGEQTVPTSQQSSASSNTNKSEAKQDLQTKPSTTPSPAATASSSPVATASSSPVATASSSPVARSGLNQAPEQSSPSPVGSSATGVRQRNAGSTTAVPGSTAASPDRHAPQPQPTGGTFSLVMIILLSFVIGLLLFRRFFLTSGWQFNFHNW